jgi:hypothetical protein
MAFINEVMVGGGGSFLRALNLSISMVIIVNIFSMFATSLLERAFFYNTTFQLSFLMSFEKNTLVV